jgi:hypothetical protein
MRFSVISGAKTKNPFAASGTGLSRFSGIYKAPASWEVKSAHLQGSCMAQRCQCTGSSGRNSVRQMRS